MKKAWIVFSAAFLCWFSALQQPAEALSAESENDQSDSGSIVIGAKVIQEKTDFVSIDLNIPVISGLSDRKFEKRLNNDIKKQAMEAKKEIIVQAKQAQNDTIQENRPFNPYELKIDYNLKNTDQILSFTITTYSYTGGAHGITATDYYNIDLKTNQKLVLKDLFKENSNYRETIDQEIHRKIKEQENAEEGSYFHPDDLFTGASAFQGISDDQSFYIENGNLVIAFAQYEIAPGYMGEPAFHIPLSTLQEQLHEQYISLLKTE
ncbi:DUF3298 and DUF4163 domain-containing protein [Sediminibacillus halophilus]|uniref:Deacetylase PdaC domain-containing protein n=1 Tax=Sediminibacillus halophilus TaxID=482461 RepID=A0A1G9N7F3_9BACI|nr:DUF3298 and DUF4163 domain-containing protein [Sediminibacillus halophilus]SDL81785.1 Protein of unknown function [Sediminibacillus halophilus]